MPTVSVLMPSYNHERFVEIAVRSVMAQKNVDFELIVIDDGSTDSSPEILNRLSKEFGFYYIHRENKGVVITLNELLSLAHGTYFCTFASDDIMPENRLFLQSDYLQKHSGTIACFGQISLIDENGKGSATLDSRYLKSIPQVTFEQIFLGTRELHGCSEMLLTDAFKKMGGYDSTLGQEDFPMILKLLSLYSPIPVISVNTCFYRIHGNNMSLANSTQKIDFLYKNMLQTIEIYREHPLYKKAQKLWKARYFSALASCDRRKALKMLPKLASCTFYFWIRTIKLLWKIK